MVKNDRLDCYGKFIFWSMWGKWDMPKNGKIKKFYKSSSFDFSILFNDRYSKGNEKDFLYFLG